jgi:hypothetical protein
VALVVLVMVLFFQEVSILILDTPQFRFLTNIIIHLFNIIQNINFNSDPPSLSLPPKYQEYARTTILVSVNYPNDDGGLNITKYTLQFSRDNVTWTNFSIVPPANTYQIKNAEGEKREISEKIGKQEKYTIGKSWYLLLSLVPCFPSFF